jgi:phosphatidylinositol dimannoside acyltransferase
MAYYIWLFLGWLANHLPKRIGYTLFSWLGLLAFYVGRSARAGALDNMRHVLGPAASDAEVWAATRAAFVHQSTNYYMLLRPLVSDDVWRRNHVIEGREHMEAALAAGKGVLVLSAHLGHVEYVAEVMRRDFHTHFLAPAETIKPKKLYDWFVAHRERHGGEAVPASEAGGMDLARRLRRGGVIALAVDLDTTRGGLPVEFFGAPALLPQGPARLALLASAPVLPMIAIRLPDGRFHLTIEPPLPIQRSRDREADQLAVMREIALMLERWISRYPTQWTMFSPIWQWAEERKEEGGRRKEEEQ